ncbi:DNA cytosine methyltransferase [Mycolicibacterium sp. 050232]|uniref:DNA cytosine methyltransferase n=1 Tax=Mycolicibacterium sp. 050232 TaxID=3113982 RepID=UPI002E2BACDF|nr:DNA cytosine methyltransferase [Mycolicibacterium sp. 050232]MED5812898.1 DNA cytosine methyltransferase [Mycolicibacterium sp. 050232]
MPRDDALIDPHPQIIDLFAGPGGLDVGATWLDIPTTGIEWDVNACKTRRKAGLDTVEGDVRNYGPADFPDATVLTGGPPCQTFTVAGTGSGRRALDEIIRQAEEMSEHLGDGIPRGGFADDRTGLVLEPMRWALLSLEAGKPFQAIVLEQVPAVAPIWDAYGKILERHGYRAAVSVLRTEEFGVPQTRRRAILIARLGDEAVSVPAPTHQAYRRGQHNRLAFGLQPWVSMEQALKRDTRFTVVSNYGSGGDPRNRGERHSHEPAATVTGKVMRNRLRLANGGESRLTHQEAGRLQTFPYDFPWSGNDIGQQIGNAIPPRLAVHVLAQALKMQIDGEELDHTVNSSWTTGRTVPLGIRIAESQMAVSLD